jgi:hypothetical protein
LKFEVIFETEHLKNVEKDKSEIKDINKFNCSGRHHDHGRVGDGWVTSPAGIDHKQQSSLAFPGPPYIPRSKSIVSSSKLPLKKTHHSY